MTAAKPPPDERDRRLADALRANLRRRKTQARAREDIENPSTPVPDRAMFGDPATQERPMIDLYAMGSPNVVKIYLALEEMELPYAVHPVDVFGGTQFSAEFRKLNPNAKVPVIVDRDGPGGKPYTVFESGAILLYLADKTGKFLATEKTARFDAIQWMMVQMTGVGPMFGQYVHFWRFAPKGNDYALDRYRTQVKRALETIEQRLGATSFLGGADYGIADIATWPWLRAVPMFLGEAAMKDYPKIAAWNAVVAARPAAQRAARATDEVRAKTTQFDKAAPEMMDKVFGRGAYNAAAS